MNRELKFRVWIKKWKRMGEVTSLFPRRKSLQCTFDRYTFDEVELMEFTGITDKNGLEIYEGDIVLTQPFTDKPFSKKAKSKRLRGIVKYNIECGKNFFGEPDKIKYWGAEWSIEIIDKKDYKKYGSYDWGLFFECEVIGNIYENPELLKVGEE